MSATVENNPASFKALERNHFRAFLLEIHQQDPASHLISENKEICAFGGKEIERKTV
jgi:hypothetical protein